MLIYSCNESIIGATQQFSLDLFKTNNIILNNSIFLVKLKEIPFKKEINILLSSLIAQIEW